MCKSGARFYKDEESIEVPITHALYRWIKLHTVIFALEIGQLELSNVKDTIDEISCIIKVMHVESVINHKQFISGKQISDIKTKIRKIKNI